MNENETLLKILNHCDENYCGWLKDEGRKRGGEEELTERGSGADGGLSSQIDSNSAPQYNTVQHSSTQFNTLQHSAS